MSHFRIERAPLTDNERRIYLMEYNFTGLEASYVKNWPETDLQLPG